MEEIIKVGKKGVIVIPKKLRKAIGINEGAEIKAELLPFGILLRPRIQNPVETLANLLLIPREKSSIETIRKLREKIDKETRKEI
ncbi:MAG: AbrB/MazE/SpoVT family DNA-binding domain-containing protein [Nitrososphaerota archaeon]